MYSSTLIKKLEEARYKLAIIEQADRIKYELSVLAINRSFRQAIDDPSIKSEIEKIFRLPQSKCIEIYNELLNKRNELTHRYTSSKWEPSKKKTNSKLFNKWIADNKHITINFQRTITNKSLTELAEYVC